MQATSSSRQSGWSLLLGAALVIVGIGAVALRAIGLDPVERIAEAGWPLFVIVPGLVLLTAALVAEPPHGVGFAVPGAIVTTVGFVLLYQNATGHWESWAYVWALVGPGAAGLGLLLYGLLFREREMVGQGSRLITLGTVLFVVGFWFFETIFESGRVPVDLQNWWPVVLIGIGLLIVIGSLLGGLGSRRTEPPRDARAKAIDALANPIDATPSAGDESLLGGA